MNSHTMQLHEGINIEALQSLFSVRAMAKKLYFVR